MASMKRRASGPLRYTEHGLTYVVALLLAGGDRVEAAQAAVDGSKAVTAVLHQQSRAITKRDASEVWIPAAETMALLSWFWFVIVAAAAVLALVFVPSNPDPSILVPIALVLAFPSAMFVSRQVCYQVIRRILRSENLSRSALLWIRRWHSAPAVCALATVMWAVWMFTFSG
ncbi:hypothetical protein [Actinacidiphila glaucinigra]|uniref:hypothetical protein n=1 Tax=Actinacidiphila glaucinigra TaxID=235986 RepID=UPI0036E08B08